MRRQGSEPVLEPVEDDWNRLDGVTGGVDVDFAEAALGHAEGQPRPDLDKLG